MKVRWLKQGNASLALVGHYIAAENPAAGRRIVDQIEEAVERLAQFPLLGRVGVVAGTRELVVPGTSYLVVYCALEMEVHILRVFHCRQFIQ
jgi:plasmid stabilization system protein ParE